VLHAKAAVADGELLFVGSANLTEFAFDLNIELGVLVRDLRIAGIVERQLRWLVESGTMERLGS
jgi:phosphatidylserine/phosphatidylglycerophosphate/cardiolipin synthase-like enzyme